jgi:hypothetical protein
MSERETEPPKEIELRVCWICGIVGVHHIPLSCDYCSKYSCWSQDSGGVWHHRNYSPIMTKYVLKEQR